MRHEWTNVDEPVARYGHGEHPDAESAEILLELNVAIDRQEYVESPGRGLQERTILETGPPFLLGRPNFMLSQIDL